MAQSFERRLEQYVEGFFARTFRSGLQPVELGKKLLREMDRGKTVTQRGVLVANHFTVTLSPEDSDRFSQFADSLQDELVKGLTDQCREEGWHTLGDIQVDFEEDEDLKLGRYVIESRIVESSATASPQPPPPTYEPQSDAPSQAPRLVRDDGISVPLGEEPVLAGRLPECGVQIADPNVSRRHAEFRLQDGTATVHDLGSTNGTFVNGVQVEGTATIHENDRITIGNSSYVFRT